MVAFDQVGVYNSMPVTEGLDLFARLNGAREEPARTYTAGRLTCNRWGVSTSGKVIELCLHDKGHSIPAEWVAEGLDWLMDLPDLALN